MTCKNCDEESNNPGQFIEKGEWRGAWVCCEACRRELTSILSDDEAQNQTMLGPPQDEGDDGK